MISANQARVLGPGDAAAYKITHTQPEPMPMPYTLTTNSQIIAAYRAATPGSAARAAEAAEMFPSGITHDSRYIEPYGLYIERAQGPRKWDVDGRCYADYFGGHGAMLLGHWQP